MEKACNQYNISCRYQGRGSEIGACYNPNDTCPHVQELLEAGYHFVNGEPVLDPELAPTMKIVAEILKSPPIGMEEVKIRNPNWEG